MNPLKLEQHINKLTMAIVARNAIVANDLIAFLYYELTAEEVAGLVLISLERLLWSESESCAWALKYLLPDELKDDIKRLISFTTYKQLIAKGLIPGQDFSITADGGLIRKQPFSQNSRVNLTQNVA